MASWFHGSIVPLFHCSIASLKYNPELKEGSTCKSNEAMKQWNNETMEQ